MEPLRVADPDQLGWRLDRWLVASEKEFGRIRLDDRDRVCWHQLSAWSDVTPVIEEKMFKREADSSRTNRTQAWGRIRCRDPHDGSNYRDVRAVRWVMTWTCALLGKVRGVASRRPPGA